MSATREVVQSRDPVELELYLLIYKFLANGPCQRTTEVLAAELERHKLLPKRLDWRGQEHVRSLESLLDINRHISSEHLLKVCERVVTLLNKDSSITSVPGVKSLLGAGRQSVLRTELELKSVKWGPSKLAALQNGNSLMPPIGLAHPPNAVHAAFGRQLAGCSRLDVLIGHHTYTHIGLLNKSLGHLSSVYCCTFDRSGKYIITGSDDYLVKIWSATNGRLLCTFRGHSAEISDIACCYRNKLLAAGSCDKLIRIWCLSSSQPVAVLHGHTHAITSLRFCPYKRGVKGYLASTGADGCLCVWEYNIKTNKFNTKPIKFIERSRAGTQMLCSSFSPGGMFLATGSSDNVIRVFSMSGIAPEKICELEAHMDRVDTIQYANHDSRFLSSSKDGTARIWRFERSEWKAIVLEASRKNSQFDGANEEADISGSSQRLRTRANRDQNDVVNHDDDDNDDDDERQFFRYHVTMACWTNDDSYVVTAVSDHTIKVWNSSSGELYRVLKGHKDEVFVLEHHPIDRRILLSAGHDGNIIIWDVLSGARIKTFHNLIEGQGHGAVFDCKWSPDGQSFAATDSHGFLLYYGPGSNDAYNKLPEEVYFHTDYRPLIRDANNYVLDEQTQHPPHAMPPPFLVDIDGNPYPPHYQRLVPGREDCSDTQLVPLVAVTPSGDREVLDDIHGAFQQAERDAPPDNPPPDAIGNGVEDRPIIDEMILRMQQVQDQRMAAEGLPVLPGSSNQEEGRRLSANQSTDHDYFTRSGRHSTSGHRVRAGLQRRSRGEESESVLDAGPSHVDHEERVQEAGHSSGPSSGGGDRNEDSQHAPPSNMSIWARRILVRELESSIFNTAESWREAMAEEEIKNFVQHRKLKPLTKAEKRTLEAERLRSAGGGRGSGVGACSNEITGRNRLLARALYDTESEEATSSGTTDEELVAEMMRTTDAENEEEEQKTARKKQRRGKKLAAASASAATAAASTSAATAAASSSATSSAAADTNSNKIPETPTSDGESSAYSDWMADAGENLQPPKRQSQRQVRRKRWSYRFHSDQSEETSEEEPEDDDRWAKRVKKNKRKNVGKALANKKVASPSPKPKRILKEKEKLEEEKPKKKFQKEVISENSERGDIKDVPPDFRPPEWLTSTVPRKAPYFPQMGDEVIYFLQGHQQYVEAVKSRKAYNIDANKNQPWHKMALREQELLKVIGIKYEIRPPRLVCLKLAFIDPETSRLIGGTFTVKYHDMPDVIDFVVLRQTYEVSMQRNWDTGDRFRCLIDDTWWFGLVTMREPLQELYPDSQFQCLLVQWDNSEVERLSPWDLEPIGKATPHTRGACLPVNQQELCSLAYEPRPHEWPRWGRAEECDRIVRGLEQIMELAIAEPFLVPVDLNVFPIYAVIIEYPIDLNTIKQRLENRFYRRIAAIQYDVRHIESNAREFNKPNSMIVKYARLVTELCLRFIVDQHCTDVMPLYTKLTKEANFALNISAQRGDGDEGTGGDGESEDEDPGEGTSAGYHRNTTGDNGNSRASRIGSTRRASGRGLSWREGCQRVLEVLLDSSDSTPFIVPVNLEEFPNYLNIVNSPMDLETVQTRLQDQFYRNPAEFSRDIRLIISNSRAYNTNKRSKIYAMTLRLSALFEEQFKCVLTDFKSPRGGGATGSSRMNSSAAATTSKTAAAAAKYSRRQASSRLAGRVRNYLEDTDDDNDNNHDNDDNTESTPTQNIIRPRRLYGSSRLAARSSLQTSVTERAGGRNAYQRPGASTARASGRHVTPNYSRASRLDDEDESPLQNGGTTARRIRKIRTRGGIPHNPISSSGGSSGTLPPRRRKRARLESEENLAPERNEDDTEEETEVRGRRGKARKHRGREEEGTEGEEEEERGYRRKRVDDSDVDFVVGQRTIGKKVVKGTKRKYVRHKDKINNNQKLDGRKVRGRPAVSNGHTSQLSRRSEGYSTRCATGSIKRKHYDPDLGLESDGDAEIRRKKRRRLPSAEATEEEDEEIKPKRRVVNGKKSAPSQHSETTEEEESSGTEEDDDGDDGDDDGNQSGNDTEEYEEHSRPVSRVRGRRGGGESSPEEEGDEDEDWGDDKGQHSAPRRTNRTLARKDTSHYGTRNRGKRTVVYHEDSDDDRNEGTVARENRYHSNAAVANDDSSHSDETEDDFLITHEPDRDRRQKQIKRRS